MLKDKIIVSNHPAQEFDKMQIALAIKNSTLEDSLSCSLLSNEVILSCSSCSLKTICDEIINEQEVYSGCYGRVSLSFYPYNKADNKGVGCGLLNVQKLEEGPALSIYTSAAEDFQVKEGEQPW